MPYQEKTGTWRAHKMINGKRKTKRFKTKSEARKWEAMQEELKWQEMTRMESLKLYDWANLYLTYIKPRVSEKTFKEEKKSVFVRLFKLFGVELPVLSMTVGMAMKYLAEQARDRGGHAANKDRKNLKAAWNWGIKHLSLSSINPFSQVEPFPADEKPRYVPSIEDVEKVISVAREDAQVFLTALLHTAARRGELFRLKWDEVDFQNSKVLLGTCKRKGGAMEYDWVPLTQQLKELLLVHKTRSSSDYVFSKPEDGHPYKWRQHLMGNLCRRAGVRKFGFHAIRHLTASMLAQKNVDIPSIQAILRHQSPMTTSRYIRQLGVVENVLENVVSGRGAAVEYKEEAPKVAASGA